jgi:hypothetical protein
MTTDLSRRDGQKVLKSVVYLMTWMEGRVRKKLRMLAVNMRV